MVKVSVIIPVYNVEPYLKQCMDSVVGQTLKDIEIICVDDGSTDNSLDILREYAAEDSRIQIIEQKNAGAGAARNNGMRYATGKYLSFLDSDDFFERNIAWQRITHENTFCLTKENTVILDSMAFINGAKEKTYYLLAVLNSSLVKFWMKKNVPEYGSTGYRFSNQFVTQIPVPLFVEEKELAKINDYVKEYFEGKDTSNVINEFVFRIFKLTKEEIKYIDSENYLYNQ